MPPAARHSSPAKGAFFGDYELLEEIAHGGMGVVYKARQVSLNRTVAVKLIRAGPYASKEYVHRFRVEASAAAMLQHPHIVAVHEVGVHEGQHYFSMDYVAGQSLAQVVREGPLAPHRAARYVQQIAEAIQYAHAAGILHRDLKPSNVLIDAQDQPRITDFGLAKQLHSDSAVTLTGEVIGTPGYMPPEQAGGRRGAVQAWSDVYALGAILYHLLTGRAPFAGPSVEATLDQMLHQDPVSVRLLNPAVPRDLDTICLKCLEKEPAKRYATAQLLADELGRFLNQKPILARPLHPAGRVWRWCRRNPRLASAMGVALLSLVIGLLGVTWQWRRVEPERQRAEAGELLARQRGYVSDMNLAQQAIKANNPGRALELLNRHRPERSPISNLQSPIQTDLRGFEWRYLWQQCQGEAESMGRLPTGIRSLEVSSNGHWLVAGSVGGAVKVWNLGTGEEISLAPERGLIGFATFSPDSRLVLFDDQSLESSGTIRVWDLQARQHLAPITDPWIAGPMAFSRDGRWFAYGVCSPKLQRRVLVRDFVTREKVGEINTLTGIGFSDNYHGLAWVLTRDGRSIIGSENDPDRRMGLWSLTPGSQPQYFRGHGEAITAMALSPDGQMLATGAGFTETGIKLWEVPSFRLLGELAGHERWIAGLTFSPDGQTLASASTDQTVRLWDVRTKSSRWVSRVLPHGVWQVCFSPDGRKLFSGSKDGSIHRWSLDAPEASSGFWLQPSGLESVTVAPDGKQFAGLRQGGVHVGEAQGAALPSPLPELGTNNTCLLFSSDGQVLFAGTDRGEVQVWSVSRRERLHLLRVPAEPVSRLRQDVRGRLLVVVQRKSEIEVGRPCRLGVWNTTDWVEQKSWTVPAVQLNCAVSPDGRWLATVGLQGPVQVWSLTRPPQTNTLTLAGRINPLAFSPDQRLLAAANEEGMVKVWEMPTRIELVGFQAHQSGVRDVAFSPDSRRLATAGDDEEAIKLWDVATWRELIALERKGEALSKVCFSADGHQLTARNSQGDLFFWRVPSFTEIAQQENQRAGTK